MRTAFIVGFAIVFRNSAAYARYTLARNEIMVMGGKLVESVVQACSFDLVCKSDEARADSKLFRRQYVHLISLLHALQLQYLRSDWQLDNLRRHISGKHPVQDSGKLPMFNRLSKFAGTVSPTTHRP